MQVQLQLHATGADKGYLVSWARTGLAIFEVPYKHDFVVAFADVLRVVIPAFIEPQERPPLPQRWTDLSADMQERLTVLYTSLGGLMASCTQKALPVCPLVLPRPVTIVHTGATQGVTC